MADHHQFLRFGPTSGIPRIAQQALVLGQKARRNQAANIPLAQCIALKPQQLRNIVAGRIDIALLIGDQNRTGNRRQHSLTTHALLRQRSFQLLHSTSLSHQQRHRDQASQRQQNQCRQQPELASENGGQGQFRVKNGLRILPL